MAKYYQHFKGHIIKVIGEAVNTENLEEHLIIYQEFNFKTREFNEILWARPKSMFYEILTTATGHQYPRFKDLTTEEFTTLINN